MEEKIEIDKKLFDDLMAFLKECSFEGNCFADAIMKKWNIE